MWENLFLEHTGLVHVGTDYGFARSIHQGLAKWDYPIKASLSVNNSTCTLE